MSLLLLMGGCSDPRDPRHAPRAAAIKGVWHRVVVAETAAKIASRYRVPVQDIVEINAVERHERLKVGRRVFVPGAAAAAGKPDKPRAATRPPPAMISDAGASFLWPVPGGKLSSKFGRRGDRTHEGIDISAPAGASVLATRAGKVIYAGSGVKGYGNLILVRHAGGLVSVYAHNRRNLVKEGAGVKQGQVIAEVGRTGRATGDHLHFEIRRGDTPVDPLNHVRQ